MSGYAEIDNEKIDEAFDMLDKTMETIFNDIHLNYYEILTILSMMDAKVKQNHISQYILETVTRFQERMNEEDEKGK